MPEATAPREPLDDLLGSVVAEKYRIDRLIGRGGMGAVFEATNLAIGKRVALKFLSRDAAKDADATERFQREARAASVVESAHIVHIFDSGTSADGLPFLVMELLNGEDLRARLNREGSLDVTSAASIVAQVLRALQRAHRAGIVHRDLKPDNVFLCQRDDGSLFVKIVDFGVSKLSRNNAASTLTQRGTVVGTAYYMSPEQAQAFPDIDGRTDLFSVGAMFYECLAGRPPYEAPTYESVLIAVCTRDPEDVRTFAPQVSEGLWSVIRQALARDREQRFSSADSMLDALLAAVPDAGIAKLDATTESGSRPKRLDSPSPFERTHRAPDPKQLRRRMRTLSLSLVAVLAGFGITTWWVGRLRDEAPSVSTPVRLATSLPPMVRKSPTPPTPSAAEPEAAAAVPAGATSIAPKTSGASAPRAGANSRGGAAASPSVTSPGDVAGPKLRQGQHVESRSTSAVRSPRSETKSKVGVVPGLELNTREP